MRGGPARRNSLLYKDLRRLSSANRVPKKWGHSPPANLVPIPENTMRDYKQKNYHDYFCHTITPRKRKPQAATSGKGRRKGFTTRQVRAVQPHVPMDH